MNGKLRSVRYLASCLALTRISWSRHQSRQDLKLYMPLMLAPKAFIVSQVTKACTCKTASGLAWNPRKLLTSAMEADCEFELGAPRNLSPASRVESAESSPYHLKPLEPLLFGNLAAYKRHCPL